MIYEHATEFAGKPVKDWNPGDDADPQFTYRLLVDYEDATLWMDKLAAFLETPGVEQATGLIVGNWGEVASGDDSAELVEALTVARDRLPNLTALFMGDLVGEESELSWINQTDVSPLFSAYPRLEHFRIRGGVGLRFGGLHNPHLKSLIVETGGLPVEALQDILNAQLPNLEHLEIWLGEENYGWNGSIDSLKPLMENDLFPKLTYLGLRNSAISDAIAAGLVNAPVLQHLRVLDLSMGTLSDEGAKALLQSPHLSRLEKLDLHHHYLSDTMMAQLTGNPAPDAAAQPPLEGIAPELTRSPGIGIVVDVSDPQQEEEYGRYVAIGSDTPEIEPLPPTPRPFVVIGNPLCPRVDRFQTALTNLGLPPAREIAWTDILAGQVCLPNVVPPGSVVRLEAPGTAFQTERALLAVGADLPDPEAEYERIPKSDAANMSFDKGRIVCPRQWYLGFQAVLEMAESQLAACVNTTRMNHPPDVALMFDKPNCQERLRLAGLPIPRPLGIITGYNDLIAKMQAANCGRVFVKLAHGSSASGVVAYRTQGDRHQATTTVEMVRRDGKLFLYNTRDIQVYTDPNVIAELINALARHRAMAEEWIPKAGMDGHCFDLRVVVIGGQAQHVVARLSRKPMTNLHLRNPRRSWEFAREYIGPAAAHAALQTGEAALRCFPQSLYAGIDLMFAPGLRRHAVLELNAFGDLLPGTLHEGQDTYTAEILAALRGEETTD